MRYLIPLIYMDVRSVETVYTTIRISGSCIHKGRSSSTYDLNHTPTHTMNENQTTLVKTARLTGIWYLLLAITGILGFAVLHSKIYSSGDPERTLQNLTDHAFLSRIRLLLELLIVLTQALAALWFYRLFRTIGTWHAWGVGIWGMINALIILISAICMAAAIDIAHASVHTYEAKVGLIDILGKLIKHLWALGGIFFGLWLIPMGHVVIVSRRMPLWLGRLLIAGGVGYILNTLISSLGYDHALSDILVIPATAGEFWMIVYLLIYGVRPAPYGSSTDSQ